MLVNLFKTVVVVLIITLPGFFGAYEVAYNECEELSEDFDGFNFSVRGGCHAIKGGIWYSSDQIKRDRFLKHQEKNQMKKTYKLAEQRKKVDQMNQRRNMHPEDFKAMKRGESVEQYKERMKR